MNKCNKSLAFPILKQYCAKFSFIFIIYFNEKSLNVLEQKFYCGPSRAPIREPKSVGKDTAWAGADLGSLVT